MNTVTERYLHTAEVQELIGHDAIMNPALMEQQQITSMVDSEALGGLQTRYFGVTTNENPTALAIAPVSWSDTPDRPFNAARFGVVAAATNMRVAVMGFPGMGHPESKQNAMTERQIEQAHNGRLLDVATRHWRDLQLDEHLLDANGRRLPVVFLNHSQSTLTGAEMIATAPEGTVISAVISSENMALQSISYPRFLKRFAGAGKHMKDYTPYNGEAFPADEADLGGQIKAQFATHVRHTPKAMSRGRQIEIMTDAVCSGRLSVDPEHGTHIHTVRAQDGLVSAAWEDQFAIAMRDLGLNVSSQTLMGEGHAYQNAMPALLAVLRLGLSDRLQ